MFGATRCCRAEFHHQARLFKSRITLSTGEIAIHWIAQYFFSTVIRWIVIYLLNSVIHSLNNWAQIYNKRHSVTQFLFSNDNKVSQRDYNNFSSQSLYLTRYKNCLYREGLVKEKSNSSKFKRHKDLDMISKLFSKNRKLNTILKIVNMKAIFAVMKLI